jgi:hypothetical protein
MKNITIKNNLDHSLSIPNYVKVYAENKTSAYIFVSNSIPCSLRTLQGDKPLECFAFGELQCGVLTGSFTQIKNGRSAEHHTSLTLEDYAKGAKLRGGLFPAR